MAETIGEALGQVPGGSGLGVTVMQRIMGLVCEHKVLPLRGNLFGNLGEFGSKSPEQGKKLLLSLV